MSFTVQWTERAKKQLLKMDKSVAELLLRWVHKNLDGCSDPRSHGKALSANHAGQWRYRVGAYRLIAEIRDAEIVILILAAGHRREIYN